MRGDHMLVEKAINKINTKLDNLEERLRKYDESNRHIIIEESEKDNT